MSDVAKIGSSDFHSVHRNDPGAQEVVGGRLIQVIEEWQKICKSLLIIELNILYHAVKLNLTKNHSD